MKKLRRKAIKIASEKIIRRHSISKASKNELNNLIYVLIMNMRNLDKWEEDDIISKDYLKEVLKKSVQNLKSFEPILKNGSLLKI